MRFHKISNSIQLECLKQKMQLLFLKVVISKELAYILTVLSVSPLQVMCVHKIIV